MLSFLTRVVLTEAEQESWTCTYCTKVAGSAPFSCKGGISGSQVVNLDNYPPTLEIKAVVKGTYPPFQIESGAVGVAVFQRRGSWRMGFFKLMYGVLGRSQSDSHLKLTGINRTKGLKTELQCGTLPRFSHGPLGSTKTKQTRISLQGL